MEFITTDHLEKYETILQQIHNELEACKHLEKQIKNENDKIVAANISLHEEILKNKLFKVNVRVFDSIFEVYEYCGASFENLQQCSGCKFYLVEVYVSTVFQDKLADQKWILNVRLRSSTNFVVSESVNLKNKAFTYPLVVVLAFDGAQRDCKVEVNLALPAESFWTCIQLEDVHVDVSHHFKINNESVAFNTSDVINICKCYCKNTSVMQSLNNVEDVREASFLYRSSISEFLKFLIWNCYHRVDPEVFSALEKSKTVNIEIKTGANDRILICFDPEEGTLKIKTTVQLLYEVKKYFIRGTNEKQVALNRKNLQEFCVCNSF